MQSSITKHSIVIGNRKTSISLEGEFFAALKREAERRQMTLGALIEEIDQVRQTQNLSSAIRVYLFGLRNPAALAA